MQNKTSLDEFLDEWHFLSTDLDGLSYVISIFIDALEQNKKESVLCENLSPALSQANGWLLVYAQRAETLRDFTYKALDKIKELEAQLKEAKR